MKVITIIVPSNQCHLLIKEEYDGRSALFAEYS